MFVTWSDGSVSPEANQVLIDTTGAPFANQRLLSVLPGWQFIYYLIIQSDAPIAYDPQQRLGSSPVAGHAAVRALLAAGGSRRIARRAHPTQRCHSFSQPAAPTLFGGCPHFGNE